MDGDLKIPTNEEWVTPDEVKLPQPNATQKALWEYLDTLFDQTVLNRELKFLELDSDTIRRLASISLAQSVGKVGKKFNLNYKQVNDLARLIKYLAIKEIVPENLVSSLQKILEINNELAETMAADVDFQNLIKEEGVPPASEASPPASLTVLEPVEKPTPETPETTETPEQSASSFESSPAENESPFMLHEEKTFSPSPPPPERPSVSFTPPTPPKQPSPKPPRAARIELPEQDSEKPTARVVHYSNLRTPLDTDAKDRK